MPQTPHQSKVDLQEASNRNRVAREIITGFLLAAPSRIWSYTLNALADTPALASEITRLQGRLDAARLDLANLAAAGLATLAAHHEAEPDPLSYLRDELNAQGHRTRGRA